MAPKLLFFKLSTHKKERYDWIRHELVRFDYLKLRKVSKGIVIRYLIKVSGYSRQQVARLIEQYRKTGYIKYYHTNVPSFQRKYTPADIRLIDTDWPSIHY